MAELAASDSSSPDTDRDFDPSADMLVHDFDDERTLEEEEALSSESCSSELDDLQKESDMPIEELLAMYNTTGPGPPQDTRSSSEEEILSNQDLTLDKEEIARDLLQNSDDDDNKETTVSDLIDTVTSSQTARLLRSHSQAGSSDEDSEDADYQPVNDDDWKKVMQVGHAFQAMVPEGMCKYGDAPAYENEDRLLWDPSKIEDNSVESYQKNMFAQTMQNGAGVNAIPLGTHIKDDEQALYLLLQCGHNIDEALRRRKMQAVTPSDPMSLWSEEECRNFESGLRTYGKDFYIIQQNKVRTRSVGELVQFYYLWKKTERHDAFANKTRLEKKRYALHPGVTDYMDRFLDDQENPVPMRDRSTSPSIHSLLYGDQKRHHLRPPSDVEDQSTFEPIQPGAKLKTAAPTTVEISPDKKSRNLSITDSAVNAPSIPNEPTEGMIITNQEPCRKKLKLDIVENIDTMSHEPLVDSNHLNNLSVMAATLNCVSNNPVNSTPECVHISPTVAPESVAQ